MIKLAPKIIFALAVQNCANYLIAVLQNIENLSKYFSEVGYIFVENDSIDNTKEILKSWGADKNNFNLINLDGLKAISARTIRLEIVRNSYLEAIRYDSKLKDFDYLAVLINIKQGLMQNLLTGKIRVKV